MCRSSRILALTDKTWPIRFAASERKSEPIDLDFWLWPLELLGWLGMLMFFLIAAADYFKRTRIVPGAEFSQVFDSPLDCHGIWVSLILWI
jgi:hypothetical protein